MAESEQRRAWIREIAFEAAEAVAERYEEKLNKALELQEVRLTAAIAMHAATCPTARTVSRSKAFLGGVAFVCSGLGAGLALLVGPLIKRWMGWNL